MARLQSSFVLALALAWMGCSQRERTIEKYDKDGIRFSHFSDWAVTEDSTIEGSSARNINLEGSDSALVTFICLPPSGTQTLDEFASFMAANRSKEMEETFSVGPIKAAGATRGSSEPTTGRVAGQEHSGILQRFNISVLGQKVPHEARFFDFSNGRYQVFLMTQVATENAADAKSAFDLTLDSFRIEDAE